MSSSMSTKKSSRLGTMLVYYYSSIYIITLQFMQLEFSFWNFELKKAILKPSNLYKVLSISLHGYGNFTYPGAECEGE